MKRFPFAVLLVVALRAITFADDPEWSIEGKVITADNCVVGCPCIFGEQPTHGRCQYTGVMIVEKGHYGSVNLENTKFALGGAFGRSKERDPQEYDFVAYYIDSHASAEQRDALRSILASKAFEMMGKPAEVKEVPISVNGLENFGKVGKTYGCTIGDIASIQVTPVSGAMAGQPIVVENSAEPLFQWTALGKTTDSYFKGAGADWTFNGTSGESHKFAIKSSGTESSSEKSHH